MAFKASTIALAGCANSWISKILTAGGTGFKRILKLNEEILYIVYDLITDAVYIGYYDIY